MNYYGLLAKDQNSNFPLTQYVKNLTIRAGWDVVEPTEGNYNWKRIDAALAALPQGGLAALTIHVGNDTPNWVMSGTQHFTMSDGVSFPAPWDPNLLSALNTLVEAVAQKYGSDQRIVRVGFPALSSVTVETTLENIGTRYGTKPSLNITEAQKLDYWDSVGYTPQKALYAVQQNTLAIRKYWPNTPILISFQPAQRGLQFDTIGGKGAIASIQSWFSSQKNVIIYNCGASNTWVYPHSFFPHNTYVYQEATGLGSQRLFNQMMVLIRAQQVNDIEIYANDLNFVPNVPPATSAANFMEAEYTGEIGSPGEVRSDPESTDSRDDIEAPEGVEEESEEE